MTQKNHDPVRSVGHPPDEWEILREPYPSVDHCEEVIEVGKRLTQCFLAMTLSAVLMSGCAVPAPQRGGLGQGPMGGGGVTPAGVYGGAPAGTLGMGFGTAGSIQPAPGVGAGRRTPPAPAADLGQRISNYVAGLDVINGGTNVWAGPMAGGSGGGGGAGAGQVGAGRDMAADMTGADTSRIGRGVGVSTMVVANRAFIGIDPATIGLGHPAGGTTASASGDARGPAGAGLEGFLRDRIRSEFPEVTEVYVTTEPGLVRQIARVTTAGHTGADSDIVQIIRRLAPASSSPR